MKFRIVLNQSEKCNYNPNLVKFRKIWNRVLRVHWTRIFVITQNCYLRFLLNWKELHRAYDLHLIMNRNSVRSITLILEEIPFNSKAKINFIDRRQWVDAIGAGNLEKDASKPYFDLHAICKQMEMLHHAFIMFINHDGMVLHNWCESSCQPHWLQETENPFLNLVKSSWIWIVINLSDRFGTKRNSACCQSNRKRIIKIQIWLN